MKKILFCVLLAVMTTSAFAQQQGRIRGGLNAGYAIPTGGGGVAFDAQLGYNITDNMNVGVKWGVAMMGRVSPDGENASLSFNNSYLATFTYFLNNGGRFAPFAGIGLGAYGVASIGAGNAYASVAGGTKFGGMLTAGFELGRLRFGVEYNLIPSSDVIYDIGVTPERTSIPNSYFAVTLGFVIGRGTWGR
jgi:outer membrane protein X